MSAPAVLRLSDESLVGQWADRRWRLHNLYWITDIRGRRIKFVPNEAQIDLLDKLWFLNIILKSRQRGFSTFIDILGLDLAVFQANQSVGVIAHGLREASGIFKTKVIFPYNNLPAGIREVVYPTADSTQELSLSNGSSVYVSTSMRSATVQFLHVSEFGRISRRYPEKAKEIVSGSFNAVHPGQMIFVESTAEGRGGEFFDMCQTAMRRRSDAPLTELDFRFHFYPWFTDPKNVLDPEFVVIGDTSAAYFAELERLGVKLRPEQKAWYVKKAEQQGDHMKAEYPSTAREAFEAAVDGFVFGKEMQRARADGRICRVPLARGYPVNTFWDLGLSRTSGTTALWCHQYVALQHRFLKCYESHGQALDHYVKWLQDTGYAFGVHYLPHDAGQRRLGKKDTKPWVESLRELMPGHTFEVLPVIDEIRNGIDQTKAKFDECVFDEVGCEDGIKAIDNYQYEWDEALGKFKDSPRHDWASNYADALRQWGQGWHIASDFTPPPIPGYVVLDQTVGM
ncbi:MAG: hypothetical protein M0Z99_33910 [Betaproteobacteria bacterium]|nr:hypothetical protein [Betaproteobacteria bacterium]